MTTDFTQDSVLHYLRKSGGAVKNSDLLLHFRGFLREHADRERNRDLFKKFVNSVATVQQIDGVSHVVLRKKFKGHVPGGGDRGSPQVPAGKTSESSAEKAGQSLAGNAEKTRQKPPQREATAPAAGGVSPGTTILPAAGIVLNNNNNVEANLDLKQKQRPDVRAAPAQVNPEKTPSMSKPPAQRLHTQVGQHMRGPSPPPGITPGGHQGETRQPVSVPDPLRGRPAGGLHQETSPPVIPHPQAPKRRHRHRKSYKSAVSCDEDEEEEEPMRRGSTGRAWPVSAPLGEAAKAMSASSPCIINQPASPSASASPSSELTLPRIYIQNVTEEVLAGGGLQWSSDLGQGGQRPRSGLGPRSVPEESIRRSLPVEAERFMSSSDRMSSQPAAQLVSTQRTDRNQLSSSHGSIFRPSSDTRLCSSERLEAASSRGSGWYKSCEDLQARAEGTARGDLKIQEAIQRAHGTKAGPVTHIPDGQTAPWYQSAELLHVEQDRRVHASPWNLSTGDLHDDREDAESSEGSPSSTPLRQRPLASRLSSHLRSRMCRSLGSDLDQFLQEDARVGGVGGNEAARLDRLHRISSSLSLHYNLSSSSLSSCSTPPRCQSLADLVGGFEGRGWRRSFPPGTVSPSTGHPEVASKQSLVPLESREHAWLVKGAAGAWPDIYSLFREDPSLLNRRDFISGFTVLHWIAKHGDHRVLNTLWYGVQKAGLSFDIDARSTCGHTPLHIAAIHNHKNIIRVLVSKFSADGKLRDTAGKKPWQYLSADAAPDVFQMLGAPPPDAGRGDAPDAAARADSSWKPEKRHHRHRRHHFSTASSGQRPVTISGTTKVKRSSSIAALLKHKSLRRFHGHQSESSI